jgi:hypothetical protein
LFILFPIENPHPLPPPKGGEKILRDDWVASPPNHPSNSLWEKKLNRFHSRTINGAANEDLWMETGSFFVIGG